MILWKTQLSSSFELVDSTREVLNIMSCHTCKTVEGWWRRNVIVEWVIVVV